MEIVYAMAGGNQAQGGGIFAFLPFLLIMVIIYFLMIRPQSKRQKEKVVMLDNLKKGDKIITVGGIHGTIVRVKANGSIFVIKVDKNSELTMNKSAVAGLAGKTSSTDTLGGK